MLVILHHQSRCAEVRGGDRRGGLGRAERGVLHAEADTVPLLSPRRKVKYPDIRY